MKPRSMPRPATVRTQPRSKTSTKTANPRVSELTEVRLRLPTSLATGLKLAAQHHEFTTALSNFLDSALVEVARYPQLKILCWGRRSSWISTQDAWSLYERNWRFVETEAIEPGERELMDRLTVLHGAGAPFR